MYFQFNFVYMAAYSHTNPYMQPECSQVVLAMALQCIHTQESGAHYTQLKLLWCSATQIPRGGLQRQPSYFATW